MTRTEKRQYEERIRELEDKLAYEMGLNEAISLFLPPDQQ